MTTRRTVAILRNPRIPAAQKLVESLIRQLEIPEERVYSSSGDLEQRGSRGLGVDVLITIGGDGTILQAAHVTAPQRVAILGVNMGRLGFMTELNAKNALADVGKYLEDSMWTEERTMLQARIVHPDEASDSETDLWLLPPVSHALNEAVVGSSAVARMATVRVFVDEAPLTVYRADSVIVATATGSTGYALSAGGPILYPLSEDIVLNPVAVHLGVSSALVLPPTSRIRLDVLSMGPASLSIDGFVDLRVGEGDEVLIEVSPYKARFLRALPPSNYYATLMKRLGFTDGDFEPRALRQF